MAVIRPATLADAPHIATVHRFSRADYYGTMPEDDDRRPQMWEHLLGEPGRLTYVAEDADRVLAVMSAHRKADHDEVLELTALYVLPDHFGEGVGSRLHQVFLDDRGPDETALLEVWAGNGRAIDFYERRGWVATSRTRPGPQETPFVTFRLEAG